MDFDPNAMNFGAAQQLAPRAEASHVAVLTRQTQRASRALQQGSSQAPAQATAQVQVVKRLEANLKQHQRQARVERLKQMQQALATQSNAQRLMQALALVKKVYTAEDAPSDLASMSVLQPILQGLLPKWKQLKAEQSFTVTAGDYQALQKLKQPHTVLSTAERAALFNLLNAVYKAIDVAGSSQVPVAATPARLMALKSQLLRATSETEKQRLQAEIQHIETARQRDYHQQCLRALQQHREQMPEMLKYPTARLLQQLTHLEKQWQTNRYAEAHHPAVPTLLQVSSRQLARLGVADAKDFIASQQTVIQQHLQALHTAEVLRQLQSWRQGFEAILQSLQDAAEARRLQAAQKELHQLQAHAAQWPSRLKEIKALEQQYVAAPAEEKAELRHKLLQDYSQLLSKLPPITSSGDCP